MIRNLRIYTFIGLFIAMANSYAQRNSKPNIIYIYADDLGYAETEPYGQQKIKTPNLLKLAKAGMTFTQHYASAPVCAPSRAMLMTGKHSGHAYIRGNYELGGFPDSLEGGQMPLPEGTLTLPKMLKQIGYRTGMAGKWGLGMHNTPGGPLSQGFDYYISVLDQKQAHNFYPTHLWQNDERLTLNNPVINVHKSLNPATATDADFAYYVGKEYATDIMAEKALQFIEDHQEQPFFLYLPFTQPHVSLQAPQEYIDMYKGVFDEKPYYGQQGYAATKYPYATYAAMITYLDAQVGKIMNQITKLGLDKNTIIMFSSDNGTTFNGGVNPQFFKSVADLRGLKMDVFEGGIRVPFIASWPGHIPAGVKSNFASAQYDIMATVAAITGQKLENTDGISLLPTMLGKVDQQQNHEFLYWEYPENGGQIAIRLGKWKAVKLHVRKKGYDQTPWMLFDLENDSEEEQDLAASHPEIIKKMNNIVALQHQQAHIKEWEFIRPKFTK